MKPKLLLALAIALTLFLQTKSQAFPKHQKAVANNNGLYTYTGTINHRIPVFLWFVVKDGVIEGKVTYTKTKLRIPITVAGTIANDSGMCLYEFAKSGNITGCYIGKFDPKHLTGNWYSNKPTDFVYSLIPKDTLLNNIDMDLKPGTITGKYDYDFGDGTSGELDIKQVSPIYCFIEIDCANAVAVTINLLRLKVPIHNNTIILKIPGVDDTCRIQIFKNLAIIDRINDTKDSGRAHGFGSRLNIIETFIKTGEKAIFSDYTN